MVQFDFHNPKLKEAAAHYASKSNSPRRGHGRGVVSGHVGGDDLIELEAELQVEVWLSL